jgi:hypothetical protein
MREQKIRVQRLLAVKNYQNSGNIASSTSVLLFEAAWPPDNKELLQ